jgi:hypothetical protein
MLVIHVRVRIKPKAAITAIMGPILGGLPMLTLTLLMKFYVLFCPTLVSQEQEAAFAYLNTIGMEAYTILAIVPFMEQGSRVCCILYRETHFFYMPSS